VEAKGENIERMREAGLIDDSEGSLPDKYYSVMVQLTPEEVEALISFKGYLDEAEIATAPLTPALCEQIASMPHMGPVF
jgi:hypothetical protein